MEIVPYQGNGSRPIVDGSDQSVDPQCKIKNIKAHPYIEVKPNTEEQRKSQEDQVKAKCLAGVKSRKRMFGFQIHGNRDQGSNESDIRHDGSCFTVWWGSHTLEADLVPGNNTIYLAFHAGIHEHGILGG